jgi:hypothetical protein
MLAGPALRSHWLLASNPTDEKRASEHTYTLKSILDNPTEGATGKDFDLYFCRKLKIGDSVIDGGDKWPEIAEILKKSGRPVDKI